MVTISEIVTTVAVLLSPLIAVQVSQFLADVKERRQRRFQVYRTLMTTRGSRLAAAHVEALNMIDVEFHGSDKKSVAVLRAWRAYLDHLNTEREPNGAVWDTRRDDLFVDLLYEMSRKVGYDFDKTHIRRTSYFPIGHGDLELDQFIIRKGVRSLFEGKTSIPVRVAGEPVASDEGTVGELPRPDEGQK